MVFQLQLDWSHWTITSSNLSTVKLCLYHTEVFLTSRKNAMISFASAFCNKGLALSLIDFFVNFISQYFSMWLGFLFSAISPVFDSAVSIYIRILLSL